MKLAIQSRRLAVMFEQGAIVAVEMSGRTKLRTLGVLHHPADFSHGIADPKALGQQFAEALKADHIQARRAVIGLPADWIMSRLRPMPPLKSDALASALRLTADRSFSTDPGELAVDFVIPAGADASRDSNGAEASAEEAQQPVLLLAMLRRRLTEVQQFAEAADLRVMSITPTTAALAVAANHSDEDLIIRINGNAAELARVNADRLTMLKFVSCPADGSRDVWAFRRAFAGEAPDADAAPAQAVVWGQGPARDPLREVLQSLGLAVKQRSASEKLAPEKVPTKNLATRSDTAPEVDAAHLAAAAALVQIADEAGAVLVNFAASKLATPARARFGRGVRVGALAGAAVIVGILALVFSAYDLSNQVQLLREQAKQLQPDVKAAEAMLARISYADQWGKDRLSMLEAVRDLTLQFPENGEIWATEISIREDGSCTITGKATQTRHIAELRDRLQASPQFDGVKLLYMRDVGRSEQTVAFSMILQLTPEASPAVSEAAAADASSPRAAKDAG